MSKGILLFSGGLDSILAQRVLLDAGLDEVKAVFFETPFFSSDKPEYYAQVNDISLHVYPIYNDFENILKQPPHGYGKHLNPCIDCHTYMINRALDIMESEGADLVATGEVLGQRPMSQNRRAFNTMETHIKRSRYLLRPLCAKLMEPTAMEQAGIVNRDRLLDLEGRSRNMQISLIEQYNVIEYPNPSGGCLLTMKEYADNIKRIMHMGMLTRQSAALLKNGRIVFYESGFAIIGRDREQNERIVSMAGNAPLYQIEHGKGPVGIILGELNSEDMDNFKMRMKQYSKTLEHNDIVRIQQ